MQLAGCGSGDEPKGDKPKADPSPTSKPSVPHGLDTAPPRKPEAAETEESAVEYGRYFAMLVQHAVRVRSVRVLTAEALDPAKCSSCRGVNEYIEKQLLADRVWAIEPDIRLGKFTARRTASGFKVLGAFAYPPGKFVTINGKKKDVATGGPYVFAADVVWDADGSQWRVLDYTFDHKPKR
jgi:hypothetical protein